MLDKVTTPVTGIRKMPSWSGPVFWIPAFLAIGVALGGAVQVSRGGWMLLVFAPLLEEIVFRAGLHEMLLRTVQLTTSRLHLINGLVAMTFAAAHVFSRGDLTAGLTVFPALAIGLLYQRQRRLLPCILVHAFFNFVWLALT